MTSDDPTPRRTGRPAGSDGDATRERILAAARARFGEAGYASASLRAIAADAGLTAAGIYRYFPSKEALYVATVQAALGVLVPRYREAIRGHASAREALAALVDASATLHDESPDLTRFLSSMMPEMRRDPALARALLAEPDAMTALVTELVALARSAGEVAPDVEPPHVVGMFLAATMGLAMWAAAFPGLDAGPVIRAFSRLVSGELFGDAAGEG